MRKSIIPVIESVYTNFTSTEEVIADYFIHEASEEDDLSAKSLVKQLNVSSASLTRFAKKCGFEGYRDFIFQFKNEVKQPENINRELTAQVMQNYESLLDKTYSLVDEEKLHRVNQLISKAKRVFLYGIGSSGFVAQEMKLRFMRLGLNCDAMTDENIIRINTALLDESCLVIGLSISGNTESIVSGLKGAKSRKAQTVFFTSDKKDEFQEFCDELVIVATNNQLDSGINISPQFPLLLMMDILYSYYLNSDPQNKHRLFTNTLEALAKNQEVDDEKG